MNAMTQRVTGGGSLRTGRDVRWLDLEAVANVTVTARGERLPRAGAMWSADCPGEQMIEVRFHRPTAVRRLRVRSIETEASRTQEMTVWACLHRGERHREVLRQQFNFSPGGATDEIEEYGLELDDVSAIQVRVVPSIDGCYATAHVSELRVASVSYEP